MASLWEWVHGSPVAIFVRESVWAYPALETLHVLGLALVFGSILAFDLRLLGWNTVLPLVTLGRHLLPWVWIGFALNAVSGLLLFASDAIEFASNTSFQVKLVLLVCAGVNAWWFQQRVSPDMPSWNVNVAPPFPARVSAVLSIVLWLAIITAGRMRAYIK